MKITRVTQRKYPYATGYRVEKNIDYDVPISLLPRVILQKSSQGDRDIFVLHIGWFIWRTWTTLYTRPRVDVVIETHLPHTPTPSTATVTPT